MTAPAALPAPPRLDSAEWLQREATQTVFRAIADAGFSARVVGGAVRNALFGKPVKDIDFATTASPDETMALAAAAGLKAVPTGIDHGTVTVIVGHAPYEVTTLREDVETFGRHARVAFTKDWEADARRRDFTINALYCDADGTVSDPLGGYPDLAAGVVRFIGDAHARIREDYLRILRFFRFHAEYGRGGVDAVSLAACVSEREGLRQLSGERVRTELLRLLVAPRGVDSVAEMERGGIAGIVLGRAPDTALLARLVDVERAAAQAPDAVLRLAALALPEDAAEMQRHLKLSSAETARLAFLSQAKLSFRRDTPDSSAREAVYRHGAEAARDALLLDWARSGDAAGDADWLRLLHIVGNWKAPAMPVRGADLLARGLPAGPRIGRILAELESWWIAEGFTGDAARIEARLSELLVKHTA
jgi:poly(A) polymerase